MDIRDFEPLPEDETAGKATTRRFRTYVFNKKSENWAEAGLSHSALWAWDVLASYWRRRSRKYHGRVPIDAQIKRKIALRDHRALKAVLDELAIRGLIAFEPGHGCTHRLTYVDVECRRDPLAGDEMADQPKGELT